MVIKKGNLINVTGRDQAIMHGCNMQGKMGRGVAKRIKEKYPDAFANYVKDLDSLKLGENSIWRDNNGTVIISALTQNFYGRDGQRYVSYDALNNCLVKAFEFCKFFELTLNLPHVIGAGYAGGSVDVILAMIEHEQKRSDFDNVIIWKM